MDNDTRGEKNMLPVKLSVHMVLDKETYGQTVSEISTIRHKHIEATVKEYWPRAENVDKYGKIPLPSTAVFWLFFWAETQGNRLGAPAVFKHIFNIGYEDFRDVLKLVEPDFKTQKGERDKDPVRRKLKDDRAYSDEALRKIIRKLADQGAIDREVPGLADVRSETGNETSVDSLAYPDRKDGEFADLTVEELQYRIREEQDKKRKMTNCSQAEKLQRDQRLMDMYKAWCRYECQFCGEKILKANGYYYIEACHIKAVKDGGNDNTDNILILCPNCHKKFDLGRRENEKWNGNIFSVIVNGEKHEVEFSLS
jgi:5-methylcytosine-specific restriction endonuclease McrA